MSWVLSSRSNGETKVLVIVSGAAPSSCSASFYMPVGDPVVRCCIGGEDPDDGQNPCEPFGNRQQRRGRETEAGHECDRCQHDGHATSMPLGLPCMPARYGAGGSRRSTTTVSGGMSSAGTAGRGFGLIIWRVERRGHRSPPRPHPERCGRGLEGALGLPSDPLGPYATAGRGRGRQGLPVGRSAAGRGGAARKVDDVGARDAGVARHPRRPRAACTRRVGQADRRAAGRRVPQLGGDIADRVGMSVVSEAARYADGPGSLDQGRYNFTGAEVDVDVWLRNDAANRRREIVAAYRAGESAESLSRRWGDLGDAGPALGGGGGKVNRAGPTITILVPGETSRLACRTAGWPAAWEEQDRHVA